MTEKFKDYASCLSQPRGDLLMQGEYHDYRKSKNKCAKKFPKEVKSQKEEQKQMAKRENIKEALREKQRDLQREITHGLSDDPFADALKRGKDKPEKRIKLVKDGVKEASIYHLKQKHYSKEIRPGVAITETIKRGIARFQGEILKDLQNSNYDQVFIEVPEMEVSDSNKMQIKFIFLDFEDQEGKYTEEQLDLLGRVGAGAIYKVLNESKVQYSFSTKDWNSISKKLMADGKIDLNDPKDIKVIQTEREAIVARKVKKYLKKYPKSKIAIIFGAAHNMKDDFAGSKASISEISFPKSGFIVDYLVARNQIEAHRKKQASKKKSQ